MRNCRGFFLSLSLLRTKTNTTMEKTLEIDEGLLREVYKNCPEEVQRLLEGRFPKLFLKFSVGSWVWLDKDDIDSLGVITLDQGDGTASVHPIIYNHRGSIWSKNRMTLATKEEVMDAIDKTFHN